MLPSIGSSFRFPAWQRPVGVEQEMRIASVPLRKILAGRVADTPSDHLNENTIFPEHRHPYQARPVASYQDVLRRNAEHLRLEISSVVSDSHVEANFARRLHEHITVEDVTIAAALY